MKTSRLDDATQTLRTPRWLCWLALALSLSTPLIAQNPGVNKNAAFNLNPGTPQTPRAPHPFESD